MKKKPRPPARPKRGTQSSSSNEYAVEFGTVLGSANAPPNSETVPESALKIRHLSMSQQSQNLLRFLNEDRNRQKFCDVSVSVGGKLYNAHKVVLAHGSSYFHAELSKNPAAAHVTLDHVEDSVFQHLLGFLYTSECAVTEMDLPALTEAARFLDMMDILKLLCEEGDSNPVPVNIAQDKMSGYHEVEMTSSDLQADAADIQSPSDAERSASNRQFSTNDSLARHLAEDHSDLQQEAGLEKEKKTGTARRSTRRRRTPNKYQMNKVEYSISTPEEKQRAASPGEQDEETDEGQVENQASKRNETAGPRQEADLVDEAEEEEGSVKEDVAVHKKDAGVCGAERHAGLQGSDVVEGADQTVGEAEGHVAAAAGSSMQSVVYPEGLAPVIIQTSSKKTLKCPKCDKTFDRAGGKHRS